MYHGEEAMVELGQGEQQKTRLDEEGEGAGLRPSGALQAFVKTLASALGSHRRILGRDQDLFCFRRIALSDGLRLNIMPMAGRGGSRGSRPGTQDLVARSLELA